MLKGFEPIVSKAPKAIILGSMPSVTSLDKQEYYGFKYNRFWKIMQMFYQMPIDTYEQKKAIILSHHLVLWDVIGECERKGSLDSAIRNEVVNPIDTLLKEYPDIHFIICNGRKSYDLFQKHFKDITIEICCVPSSSNANRSIKEAELIQIWMNALNKI